MKKVNYSTLDKYISPLPQNFLNHSNIIITIIIINNIIGLGITDKISTRKGRGKYGIEHYHLITVNYQLRTENDLKLVCKKMYQGVYRIGRGNIDIMVKKKKEHVDLLLCL